VITGIGVLSHFGCGVANLMKHIDSKQALSEIKNFSINKFDLSTESICTDRKLRRLLTDGGSYALHTIHEAISQSNLDLPSIDTSKIGVFFGKKEKNIFDHNRTRYVEIMDKHDDEIAKGTDPIQIIMNYWPSALSPAELLKVLPNLDVFIICTLYQLHGPSFTYLTPYISALQGLESAWNAIACGQLMAAVVTGTSLSIDPIEAARHEEINRFGLSAFGEGAATIVLEEFQSAKARSTEIICEVLDVNNYMIPEQVNPSKKKQEMQGAFVEQFISQNFQDSILITFNDSLLNEDGAGQVMEVANNPFVFSQSTRGLLGIQDCAGGLLHTVLSACQLKDKQLIGNITCNTIPSEDRLNEKNWDGAHAHISMVSAEGFAATAVLKASTNNE